MIQKKRRLVIATTKILLLGDSKISFEIDYNYLNNIIHLRIEELTFDNVQKTTTPIHFTR